MTKSEMLNLVRLQNAIKHVMVDVAYQNASKVIFDNRTDTVDEDVDTAFMAISYCFTDFESIDDTVTRRCAKTEIYEAIRSAQAWRKLDANLDILGHIKSSITAESVIEDIINMNSDDDEDSDEIDLDFDVTTDNKVS